MNNQQHIEKFNNAMGLKEEADVLNIRKYTRCQWVTFLNKMREQARFVVVVKKGEKSNLKETIEYCEYIGLVHAIKYYRFCKYTVGEEMFDSICKELK